ncbi:HNH endonuclease [Auritidibacter sp. NML120779]|nr:HNH endonuclease [Auritidibacter sp. NML120779]
MNILTDSATTATRLAHARQHLMAEFVAMLSGRSSDGATAAVAAGVADATPEVTADVTAEAGMIELLTELERTKNALTAAEVLLTSRLYDQRIAREKTEAIPADRRGAGLAAEIGLARHQSPARGHRFLNLARNLTTTMPRALDTLADGHISEESLQVISRELSGLTAEHQRTIDAELAHNYPKLSAQRLARQARGHAQRLDADHQAAQARDARPKRSVTIKDASPGMSYLIGYLPTEQATAIKAGLTKVARRTLADSDHPDPRSLKQLEADLLVEYTTGQRVAPAVSAHVGVLITAESLFGEGKAPAWISGQGPLPADAARKWLKNPEAKAFLRRFFINPSHGGLIGMESTGRSFTPGLKTLISSRDDVCRTPFCDNPIQEFDHAIRYADGGATSWDNGQGLCASCNQNKEKIGWTYTADADGVQVETPTGQTYQTPTTPVIPGLVTGTGPPELDDDKFPWDTDDDPPSFPESDGPPPF